MFDVISIGAATADIFIKSESFYRSSRFISVKRSSKNDISESLICSGGGATNSATTFSRLGLNTALLSLIGTDPLSQYIKQDLATEKITSLLSEKSHDTTDFSVILVTDDGSRSILTNRGSTRLESKNIPWSRLKTKWFYLTSLEGNFDLLEKIIGFAQENDIKISFNPGSRELGHRRQLLPLLKYLDFLLLNRSEAEALVNTNRHSPDFWEKLRKCAPLVAITNGRLGAKILTPTDTYYSPIINTDPLDETGAGDAFGSAFVSALIYNHSLPEALSWGIKNSASVVSALGAKKAILNFKQISHVI